MGKPLIVNRSTYCCYCKRGPLIRGEDGCRNASGMTATRDHFVPQHEGLEGAARRWVPCCLTCNGLKGGLRPGAWLAFIDANPRYWKTYTSHKDVILWLISYNAVRRERGWRSLPLFSSAPDHFMAFINRP